MIRIILLSLLLVLPSFAVKMYQPKQYSYVKRLAKEQNKLLVIYYHTKWCKYCKQMENDVFNNDQFTKAVKSKYIFLTYDIGDKSVSLPVNPSGGVPEFHVLDPNEMMNNVLYHKRGAILDLNVATNLFSSVFEKFKPEEARKQKIKENRYYKISEIAEYDTMGNIVYTEVVKRKGNEYLTIKYDSNGQVISKRKEVR